MVVLGDIAFGLPVVLGLLLILPELITLLYPSLDIVSSRWGFDVSKLFSDLDGDLLEGFDLLLCSLAATHGKTQEFSNEVGGYGLLVCFEFVESNRGSGFDIDGLKLGMRSLIRASAVRHSQPMR